MAGFGSRLKHAWNVFFNQDSDRLRSYSGELGASYGTRPDRTRLRYSSERSIISSIYTRIGIDAAAVNVFHSRLNDEKQFLEEIDSGLNNCLTVEANIDQGATAFRQDVFMTLVDKGVVAIVPIDTSISPLSSGGYDIKTLRVGEIVSWMPRHVRVSLYDERDGTRKEVTIPKSMVGIAENPLYSVMNEPNSTLQRLIRKLNLLDAVDEQSASGKLDLIVQLPYVIKSEARKQQAEQRRKDIEFQLKGSQYGIAYTDGTEKITQLNRPAENNLLAQIEYLTKMLYGQLGLTEEIMNGTADEAAMLNYFNRTIDPIVTAVVESMKRAFLTSTARTQLQSIEYFRNPFKLVPLQQFADIVDKLTRNEVASANEIRAVIGWKPSKDPKANQLINSNMPQPPPTDSSAPSTPSPADGTSVSPDTEVMSQSFDAIDSSIDEAFSNLGLDEGATSEVA